MRTKSKIMLLLITTFSMIVVALYNGYGLLEGDTGAYIETGIRNLVPNDRSPFYGWFMRYTSLWTSLWFTLLAQSALLSWLLLKYINTNAVKYLYFIGITIGLGILTKYTMVFYMFLYFFNCFTKLCIEALTQAIRFFVIINNSFFNILLRCFSDLYLKKPYFLFISAFSSSNVYVFIFPAWY